MITIKIQISKFTDTMKKSTILNGVISIIFLILEKYNNISFGLFNISFAIFILGLAIQEFNIYKKTQLNPNLILGITFVMLFILNLSIGISQFQNIFYIK